jgi:hypothetical protein
MRTLDREQPTSTVDGGQNTLGSPAEVTRRDRRRARAWRRLGLLLMAAILILGALGFFGGRTGKVKASANRYQLEITYPRTGRPGIGAPMQIQVQKQGGFQGPVTVSVSSEYLDILNIRDMQPSPQQSTSSNKAVTWQFTPPPGDTLVVSLSAEFDTDEHPGTHDGAVTVIDEGKPAVSTHFTTWEAP